MADAKMVVVLGAGAAAAVAACQWALVRRRMRTTTRKRRQDDMSQQPPPSPTDKPQGGAVALDDALNDAATRRFGLPPDLDATCTGIPCVLAGPNSCKVRHQQRAPTGRGDSEGRPTLGGARARSVLSASASTCCAHAWCMLLPRVL